MEDDFTIRVATTSDSAAIALLVRSYAPRAAEAQSARWEELLQPSGDTDERLVLVAETSKRVVAYGRLEFVDVGGPHGWDGAVVGWYLLGVVVDELHRRRGIGRMVTQARLRWLKRRADFAYYFTGHDNDRSIALHRGSASISSRRA